MATKGRYFQLNYPKRICLQQIILTYLFEIFQNKFYPVDKLIWRCSIVKFLKLKNKKSFVPEEENFLPFG